MQKYRQDNYSMKEHLPPNSRYPAQLKEVGNGADTQSCASRVQLLDADLSMDDYHAPAISVVTSGSGTIESPPRTQRRKRTSIGVQVTLGPAISQSRTFANDGTSVCNRLFPDDDNHNLDRISRVEGNYPSHPNHDPYLVEKTFVLNQEVSDTAELAFDNINSLAKSPGSSPCRGRRDSVEESSILIPFCLRRDRNATMALRKRQAEQSDLCRRGWSCDEDALSATESPVDMYTSPRISPYTPNQKTKGKDAKSEDGRATHRSPFHSKHQQQQGRQQQLQYHKSPSHFQTLDGRTVQSKNPFSPMIFDETPTPSKLSSAENFPALTKNEHEATAGLTHPLLLTSDSLTFPAHFLNVNNSDPGGKSHLILRRKLQKREGSPCNVSIGDIFQHSAVTNDRMITKESKMDGLKRTASTQKGKITAVTDNLKNSKNSDLLEQKAFTFLRDRYPEQSSQYSFTGPLIKATVTTSPSPVYIESASKRLPTKVDMNIFRTTRDKKSKAQQEKQDFSINSYKVRRRSKGDDVVAAAAQVESSWRKKEMYVKTKNGDGSINKTASTVTVNNRAWVNNFSRKCFHYKQKTKQEIIETKNEDSTSPTDVFNYPQFRAPLSDISTLPPTPSKPVRRPPMRRYTPIQNTTCPPLTPMPFARQPQFFDFEVVANKSTNVFDRAVINSEDDSDNDETDGRIKIDHLHGRERVSKSSLTNGFAKTSPLPPSRFYSDFDVIEELGSGSFGKVFKTLSRLDGCFYAIKVAHRVAKGIADKDRMLKEVYALAALSDRTDTATFHIVRYHQAWMEQERLYIQTELCTTTLQAQMQLAAPNQLPLLTRYKCLREILLALNFIHNNQMVHLDIKPENIFMKNEQFKLGDFGLVSKVSSRDVEEGDSRYMSMELLSGDHADLTKSDVYSLGIAIYEVCLGNNRNLPSNGPEWQLLRSGRIILPTNTTNELFQIIKKMMNPIYRERPCASDLLKLPELLSEEQKMMFRERKKLAKASKALAARSTGVAKPKSLVRRNTWSGF